MKRIFLTLICISFCLCSCAAEEVDLTSFDEAVKAELDNMKRVEDSKITEYFKLSVEDFVSAAFFVSEEEKYSDEMAIFKAADEEALNKILKAVNRRIEEKKSLYPRLSTEYKKLDGAEIESRGLYCYYFVSDEVRVGKIINRYFIDK